MVFTNTGRAARSLSVRRPKQQIFAFSPDPITRQQIQLLHGVLPLDFPTVRSLDRMEACLEKVGRELGLWNKGERIVLISGPPGVSGGTNLLKIYSIHGP